MDKGDWHSVLLSPYYLLLLSLSCWIVGWPGCPTPGPKLPFGSEFTWGLFWESAQINQVKLSRVKKGAFKLKNPIPFCISIAFNSIRHRFKWQHPVDWRRLGLFIVINWGGVKKCPYLSKATSHSLEQMVLSLYLWGTSSAGTGVQRTPPRWTGNPSCTGIQSRNRSCWRWEGTVCSAWSGREREDKWARVIREDVWYEMFFTNYNGLIAMLLCVILSFPDISVWIKTHLFRKKRYFAPKWVEQRPTISRK